MPFSEKPKKKSILKFIPQKIIGKMALWNPFLLNKFALKKCLQNYEKIEGGKVTGPAKIENIDFFQLLRDP